MKTIEAGDICENEPCDHPATGLWVGDNGTLTISRDYLQAKWCACCMTKAQIKYAEGAVARLESLRAKLVTECEG